MKTLSGVSVLCGGLLLTGCAALTPMQDAASKFDEAVHSAGTAEIGLFGQVRAAECNRDFFNSGFLFAISPAGNPAASPGGSPIIKTDAAPAPVSFDLNGRCVNHELTDAQLAERQKLIDTITLYADAIQSLTTPDHTLTDSARSLAGNIKDLADAKKFTSVEVGGAEGLDGAIVLITQMVLDRKSHKSVTEAAAAMQAPLTVVINHLKAENTSDAVGLSSKATVLASQMRSGLAAARDKMGPASFLDVIFAKQAMQSLVITPPDIAKLNGALDAVLAANAALAHSKKGGGAIPAISELKSRAEQAAAAFSNPK